MFKAETALNQLTQSSNGSGRLKVMIGAKNFVKSDEEQWVSFKYPRGKYVKIKLNSMDLYDVEFGTIRKFEYKVKNTYENTYAEDLKEIFEQETKLYLSL
tara:strand:+ start:7172 stop:7471 length:300 start_codon:yes stop_codon:yes gene_type:complete